MASVEECEAALTALADLLGAVDADTRRQHVVERTLSCTVPDLGVVFAGRLGEAGLTGITHGASANAQIRLRCASDDLVALTRGELNFAAAWATGRLKVDASLGDMLRLRSLL